MMRRLAKKNKQNMYYSLSLGEQTVYDYDDDGNKIPVRDFSGEVILDEEGNVVYSESGKETQYGEPIPFSANISGHLSKLKLMAYGVDESAVWAELTCPKGKYPFQIGTLVWRNTEPGYLEDRPDVIDPRTSDYTIMGIMDEALEADFYLLQRNTK